MGARERRVDLSRERGRALASMVLRELATARRDRNVSGRSIAEALGCSPSWYSRLEHGQGGGLTFEEASVALDTVGLRLAVNVYPVGLPIRDAAHAAVIERLRARCHPSIRVLTEVPLPSSPDLRAWDVVLRAPAWRHAMEIETRPRDRQALERRIALKSRDGGIAGVSLVLLDSRHNREFIRTHAAALVERFPVPSRVALAALRVGADPGAGSVILL